MHLPMLGTDKQTEMTQFQVILTDKTDKTLHPMKQPKTNRFFDNAKDRDAFVNMFEQSIHKAGGRLVKHKQNHPLFTSFNVVNRDGHVDYDITIYH